MSLPPGQFKQTIPPKVDPGDNQTLNTSDQHDNAADISDTFLTGLDVKGTGPGSPSDRARHANPGKLTIESTELT